jgi:hypothetical protein
MDIIPNHQFRRVKGVQFWLIIHEAFLILELYKDTKYHGVPYQTYRFESDKAYELAESILNVKSKEELDGIVCMLQHGLTAFI